MAVTIQGVPACVRCTRSEDEHLHRDEADEIQQRIWKALGWPCAEFILTPSVIYAGNQAATSRWARPSRRQPARPATASAEPSIARDGAAAARLALARRTNDAREAS